MSKKARPRALRLGTISAGTYKPEDLLPAYLDALNALQLSQKDRMEVNYLTRTVMPAMLKEGGERLADAVDQAILILENYVPEFCRFGAHEGDGADFGVWVDWDRIDWAVAEREMWRGMDAPPKSGRGDSGHNVYWLQVNDHGNATLLQRAGTGRWKELWSIV